MLIIIGEVIEIIFDWVLNILKLYSPINNITKIKLENIMCEYSARKNKANAIDEYSTLYPDTSSDSPSDKSKGALLVSANIDIKYIKAIGHKLIIKKINYTLNLIYIS